MVQRLGILGGTFDPIHIGHLATAINARQDLGLEKVLLVVANEPWQKVGLRHLSEPADRLAMVQAALEGIDGVEASSIEIDRGGLTYTVDTMRALKEQSDAELYLIVGADVVAGLPSWDRVEELKRLCQLVVVNRPGTSVDPNDPALAGWHFQQIEVPSLEVSSTDLRERAASGRPLEFLVPDAAIRVIRERGLYAVHK